MQHVSICIRPLEGTTISFKNLFNGRFFITAGGFKSMQYRAPVFLKINNASIFKMDSQEFLPAIDLDAQTIPVDHVSVEAWIYVPENTD